MRPRFRDLWRLAPLLFAGLLAACDGPCESLADRICSCEPNRTEERGCLEQVNTAMAQFAPTAQDTSECSRLLDECTCEALEAEDYAKCGLTK